MHILDLPESCIWETFHYLTIPERVIAGKVCQRWRKLEQSSSHQVRMLDCFDPNWIFIFDENSTEFDREVLFSNIFSQYGNYIECLKSNGTEIYQIVPVFSIRRIMDACPQLKYIQRFEYPWYRRLESSIEKYKHLIEFRSNCVITNFMNEFLPINNSLERLCMVVTDGMVNSLPRLADKPIKELEIDWRSEPSLDPIAKAIERLPQLEILRVTHSIYINPETLLIAISRCTKLKELTIRTLGLIQILLCVLPKIPHLIQLNLQNDYAIDDLSIYNLVIVAPQLISLNLSNCEAVTDKGLKHLSQLTSLEKLYLDELRITGEGLMEIKSLKYLTCRHSTIFDGALCCVVRSCSFIEFLDISGCQNITIASIEHAKRITADRDNRIKLEIHLDYELLNEQWVESTEYLDLVCEKSSLYIDEMSQFRIIRRSKGKSSYNLYEVIRFLESIRSSDFDVPELNDDCLYHILTFLSVLELIRMKIVSTRWNVLLYHLLRLGETLDLSKTDCRFLQLHGRSNEFDNLLLKLLERDGPRLKELTLNDVNSLRMFTDHCPNLVKLDLKVLHRRTFAMAWNQDCCHLTTLTLAFKNDQTADFFLGTIFRLNQHLKSVSLFWVRHLDFTCLQQLNPLVIEKLHFHLVFMTHDTETSRSNLKGVLSSFMNLKDFFITPANFNAQFILESFQRSSNIEALGIIDRWDLIQLPADDFQHIYQLRRLKTLVLHWFLVIDDNVLDQLRNRLSELSHVDITKCHQVTDEGLSKIATIPNLHTLIVNDLTKIRGSGLLLAKSLRHLECERCYRIQNDHLCRVLENCSTLKFLNVVGCPKLNEGIIDTAFEVASARTNNVLLKLFTSLSCARQKRLMAPPLLRIFFTIDKKYH